MPAWSGENRRVEKRGREGERAGRVEGVELGWVERETLGERRRRAAGRKRPDQTCSAAIEFFKLAGPFPIP